MPTSAVLTIGFSPSYALDQSPLATLTNVRSSLTLRYYSQLYLYAFICLFIYVNISLFTAVILDSYSLIKYYYQHGFPKSDLFEFIDELSDPPEGQTYREVRDLF